MTPVEVRMRVEAFSFGSIRIDGVTYTQDVVIDRGHVRKRKRGLLTVEQRTPSAPLFSGRAIADAGGLASSCAR
jgi:hypothetical protein